MSIKITKQEAVELCGDVINSIEKSKGIEFIFRNENELIVATKEDCFNNGLSLETIRGVSGRSAFIVPLKERTYINQYRCPTDNSEWEDAGDCICNDRCPTCDKEIEPISFKEVRDV